MPKSASIPRQRPVSCRFCRTRKLRCSRESPCSNCLSRGLTCELESTNNTSDDGERAALLERIRKLEELVERANIKSITQDTCKPKLSSNTALGEETLNRGEPADVYLGQTPILEAQPSPHPPQTHPPLDPILDNDSSTTNQAQQTPLLKEQLDRDFAWLESIYDGAAFPTDEIPSTKAGFRICSLQHMSEVEQSIPASFGPSRIFWLPEYAEAQVLLDKFVQDIEHMHHMVLVQSLPSTLARIYSCLTQQGQVKSGDIILLVSIFAAAMHAWTPNDCSTRGIFTTCTEPQRKSALWVKATEDLLDIAHRTTQISVEGIQGIVIVTFIAASYKGFSRRCWFLMNQALLLAREIGLHRIDHPSNADRANTAQAEIGRRVWWYLVASDWAMTARFNGLARGTYQCHPRHMMTHKPLNLDDEDIVDGMSRTGKPLHWPTSMSYALFRIRLHEISRTIVDRAPLACPLLEGPSYDVVMDIDTEMLHLLNDIPPFFKMTPAEISKKYKMNKIRADSTARQGRDFYIILYSQRCKLHLPYARRGFTEPQYAPSRDICVESARLIIHTEKEYQRQKINDGGARYQPLLYSMTVFLACTILLMDYCHRLASQRHETQRMDICHAIGILEAVRLENDIAAKLLDSMVLVLQKHGIVPPKRLNHQQNATATLLPMAHDELECPYMKTSEITFPVTPMSTRGLNTIGTGEISCEGVDSMEHDSELNDLVRSLDQGVDVGMIEWDDIFLGLDSCM